MHLLTLNTLLLFKSIELEYNHIWLLKVIDDRSVIVVIGAILK